MKKVEKSKTVQIFFQELQNPREAQLRTHENILASFCLFSHAPYIRFGPGFQGLRWSDFVLLTSYPRCAGKMPPLIQSSGKRPSQKEQEIILNAAMELSNIALTVATIYGNWSRC